MAELEDMILHQMDLSDASETLEVELVEGGKGIFDVTVDDKLVYSKFETGRHAEPGEVVTIILQARS